MSLCFSPVGEAFRNRAKKFPALVNCSVIDWFHPWPEDALFSVAEKFLAEVEMASDAFWNHQIHAILFQDCKPIL
jgi:dynein heavy chain